MVGSTPWNALVFATLWCALPVPALPLLSSCGVALHVRLLQSARALPPCGQHPQSCLCSADRVRARRLQLLGFSDLTASSLMALFAFGCALGAFAGGWLGAAPQFAQGWRDNLPVEQGTSLVLSHPQADTASQRLPYGAEPHHCLHGLHVSSGLLQVPGLHQARGWQLHCQMPGASPGHSLRSSAVDFSSRLSAPAWLGAARAGAIDAAVEGQGRCGLQGTRWHGGARGRGAS